MSVAATVDKFRRLYPNIEDVKSQFQLYDADGDGNITLSEIQINMTASKDFTKDQATYCFEVADTDGDGQISISEWVTLMFPTAKELIFNLRKNFKGPEDVEKRFKKWDVDGDGKISFAEMKEAMVDERNITEEDINAIFAVGDSDLDGAIDFNEFSDLMVPTVDDIVAKFRFAHKHVKNVREAFAKFDRNHDGAIDKGELASALTGYHFMYSDQEIDIIFNAMDADGDGEVTYEEFVKLMCPDAATIINKFRKTYKNMAEVKAAFRKFDKNRDGSLSKGELERVMFSTGVSFTDVEVDAIMNLGDTDGDGFIDLEEFTKLMSPSAVDVVVKLRGNYSSIADVKLAFQTIDADADGLLSREEVLTAPGNKFDVEEVNAIFELGDTDGDGQIDMGEFIAIMYPSAGEAIAKLTKYVPNIEEVKRLFAVIDVDMDGHISKEELREASQRFSEHEVDAIFALGDANDDGVMDLEEFIGVLYPGACTVVARLKLKFSNLNDVKKAFASIDDNSDGRISKDEMSGHNTFNQQEIDAIFTLADTDHDGEIDLEEFIGVLYPILAKALAKFTRDIRNVNDAKYLFHQLDRDHDGMLSQEEMRNMSKFSIVELEALFAVGDINNDGELDENEFISVICPTATTVVSRIAQNYQTKEEIQHLFHIIDKDHDGKISKEEMADYGSFNEQQVEALFQLADSDNDGEISQEELIAVMSTSSAVPYSEGGHIEKVGELDVYVVGEGSKCIIWCHDLGGFTGKDRTRQLADKIASAGYLVIIPDFFRGEEVEITPPQNVMQPSGERILKTCLDKAWLSSVSNWCDRLRDDWVESLLPWARDHLGVKAFGALGTGWGSYMATRISSYSTDVVCGVVLEPSTTEVVAATGEDLYEILEEVACPQLVITAVDDSVNDKVDGLAWRVWKSMAWSKKSEFKEFKDVNHGFLLRGDRAVEAVAVNARITLNMTRDFFDKHLHYDGEPVPEVKQEITKSRTVEDFDIKLHNSNACPQCLEIKHAADKATARSY